MIYESGAEDDLRSGWDETLTEGARLLPVHARARFLGSERTAAETPPRTRVTRRPPPSGSGARARAPGEKRNAGECGLGSVLREALAIKPFYSLLDVLLDRFVLKDRGVTRLPLLVNSSRFGKRMILLWAVERTRMIH